MVALKQLFDDPKVEFVAGRNFLLHGTQYNVGDVIDNDIVKSAKNRESLMRSRRTVAVTDDLNFIPRAYRKEIQERALFYKKNNRTDPLATAKTFKGKVSDRSVGAAKELLNAHRTVPVWAYASLDERFNGDERPTLITFLQSGTAPVDVESVGLYAEDADNYAEGQPLHDFAAQAGL